MKSICCIIFSVSLLLVGCSTNQRQEAVGVLDKCSVIGIKSVTNAGDTVVVCDIAKVKDSFLLSLSLLVDTLQLVKLDQREDALVGKSSITISENYIGIYDYKNHLYKLFTRQGEFLHTIGSIGQGPGEYKILYDSQIDEKNNRIYLFPWTTQKVLVYDLDGRYVEDIILCRLVHKGCFMVDPFKKQLSILNLPFMGNPVAWLQDFEGNVMDEILAPQLELLPDYSNEIMNIRYNDSLMSFSLLHAMSIPDSLYHYWVEPAKLFPVFTATFGNNIPIHYYCELPGFYEVNIIGKSTDPDYTGAVEKKIIIDKKTLRGGYYQLVADQLGGILLTGEYSEYGCVVNIEPGILLEQIEHRLSEDVSEADEKILTKLKSEISEQDNNYVFIGKWK